MNHCNQVNVPPILSKFNRGDDNLSATAQKYNGHGNSNANVGNNQYQANIPPYTPSSAHLHASNDDKQRLANSFHQTAASNAQMHQTQPEITQEICNALLNQQNDAKRGKKLVLLAILTCELFARISIQQGHFFKINV